MDDLEPVDPGWRGVAGALGRRLGRALVLGLVAEPVVVGVGLDRRLDLEFFLDFGRASLARAFDQRRSEQVAALIASGCR